MPFDKQHHKIVKVIFVFFWYIGRRYFHFNFGCQNQILDMCIFVISNYRIISNEFNHSNHNLSLLIQFKSFDLLMHFRPTKLVLFEWDSGRKDAQKSNWMRFFESIQRKCIFGPHHLALTIVGPLFTISFAKCKYVKKYK